MLPTVFTSQPPQPHTTNKCGAVPQKAEFQSTPTAQPQTTPMVSRQHSSISTTTTSYTTVEISGGSRSLTSAKSSGVNAYKEVGTVEKLAETTVEKNPFAKTILSFVELQLQRDVADGATQEELQSRLEAGLKGFEEGYSEAYNQLKDSGLLSDEVKAEIQETFSQVRAGLVEMAEKFGLEPPTMDELDTSSSNSSLSAPVHTFSTMSSLTTVEERYTKSYRDLQTIKHLQKTLQNTNTYEHLHKAKTEKVSKAYSVSVAESRDFSFQLRTQDGDTVTVKISNSQFGVSGLSIPESGRSDGAKLGLQGQQSSNYKLDIDGELDADELDAITQLLDQVGDISETFYSGEFDQALDMASRIDFNVDELSGFDLSLGMSSSETITQALRLPKTELGGFERQSLPSFGPFVQQVQKAGDMAEKVGQPRKMVPEMLEWLGRSHHGSHPHTKLIGPVTRAVI